METKSQKALKTTRQRRLFFVMLLTFIRFPLVLLFAGFAIKYTYKPSLLIFVIAFTSLIASAVTDLFDGYFARRFHVETSLGAHADPLMDKFFYVASLPVLVFIAARNGSTEHSVALLLITVLFLARDLWVTFLRSIGSIYN
ncbi:MAG: CDP-alcohol phosphatidyltransferase family protein, partial [Kiritimatiellae bacterium]|nr:CDP-alcohol phosphatidyltransferase family protein [Kiritimatiellia bacterium]